MKFPKSSKMGYSRRKSGSDHISNTNFEYADKPEVKSDGEQMKGWSKTLEVEYKHSRHSLDQLFNIQVTFLVDPAQPIESVNNMELRLKLTLWGVAHRVAKSSPLKVREEMMEALSERVVTVHASVQSGLHWAAPIVFDFCHRCCILIAIHAQMWSLSQPKFWRHYASSAVMNGDSSHLSVAPSSKTTSSVKGYPLSCDSEQQSAHVITSQPTADTTELFLPQGVNHDFGAISNGMSADVSSLSVGSGGISSGDIEHVLFGRALLPTDTLVDFERGRVMSLCKNIFYTLLTAQQSILTAIHQHNPHFNPQINTDSRPEQLDLSGKLRHVMNKVTQCECPDDIVAVVGTNLASLDAENMLLWDEFIKAATVMLCDLDEGGKGGGGMEFLAPNYTLNTHLLTIHHQMMVEKYAEAFFYSYRQKALAAAFASSEMRQQVCEVLRNSAYIRNLPPLPIECEESQLNPDNMPIIFEEIYVENPTDYIVAAVSSSASSPNMTGEEGDKLKDSDNGVIVNGGMSDVVNGTDPSASHLLAEGSLVALNPLTHSRSSSAEQQRLSHLPKASNSTPVLRSPNSPAHLISTKNNSSSPVSTRTYNVISNNRSRSKHVKTDESFCPTCYNWPLVISATTHKPPYSKDHCTNGEGLVNGDSNKAQGHKGARKYRSFSCSTVQSEFEVLLHSELSQQRSTLGQGTTTSSTAETVLISPSFSVHRDRNRRQAKLGCSLLARKSRSSSETTVMQTPEEKIETQRPMFSNPTASQNQWTPAIELDDAHVCERCETRRSVRNMSRIKQAKDLLSQFASELHTTLNTSVPKEASSCSNDVVESRKALANNRPVSPFQAILAGAVESDNVLWSSFLDDVQCSRMEPLLYTRKHINQVKRLRREVESSLMEQKIKLNWYAHLSSVSPSSSAPLSSFACTEPYFNNPPNEFAYHHLNSENIPGCHLVVCVHGLDGNCQDLRTLRTFLLMTMQLPLSKIRFLMSRANEDDTMNEMLESLTNRLVHEVDEHIQQSSIVYHKISFIGHSLGALIIRAALAKPPMQKYLDRLHTYLSLAGPHLGTGYQNSRLVSAGMWVFQKLKKSPAISQLSLKDEVNLEKTFVYKTSTQKSLEYFKNVLLVSSHQDKYVPPHSARIELCERAVRDDSPFGRAYRTMVDNILSPLIAKPDLCLVRYDVSFPLSASAANNLIGRTAHIAVLDSEVWLEKFFTIVAMKYFT